MSLEAMDETARECANFMVADYIARKKEPDRDHRKFGNLFMESDRELLRILLDIVDHMHEEKYPECEIVWTYEHAVSQAPQFRELILGKEKTVRLDSDKIEEVCELLIRNGLAAVATGFGSSYPGDPKFAIFNTICRISTNHLPFWRTFRTYLAPIRNVNPAT